MLTSNPYLSLALGLVVGLFGIPLLLRLARAAVVEVEDEEIVLLTRFGRLVDKLRRPGLHFLPSRLFPWVNTYPVSLKRDFRHFSGVHVNDSRGTTVTVDLWLEFRIVDAEKALFQVAEWDRSLQNLVTHAATAILSDREFKQILHERVELGQILKHDLDLETSRWGIQIESALISALSLLPEVSQQIFESVAARLERARAAIEEQGRIDVAQLNAETSVRVAALVAEAKGQYPLAIGAALARLQTRPQVLAAYSELYELSHVRPHRTIAFRGFGDGEMRAVDAAMMLSTAPEQPHEGGAAPQPRSEA